VGLPNRAERAFFTFEADRSLNRGVDALPAVRNNSGMNKPLPSARDLQPVLDSASSLTNRAQLAGRRARILREIEQAQRNQPGARGHLRRLRDELAAIEFPPPAGMPGD
jgi:hypothetical protein